MSKKQSKICLIVDVRGWAFENIALKIKDRLESIYEVDIVYMDDYKKSSELFLELFNSSNPYDLVHFFWRGLLGKLFDSNTIATATENLNKQEVEDFLIKIASSIKTSWVCDHLYLEQSIKSIWMRRVLAYIDQYAVSSEILNSIYSGSIGCPSADAVIADGVDLSMFIENHSQNKVCDDNEVVIGWAGNSAWGAKSADHKGLVSVIKPAIAQLKKEGYSIKGLFCDRQERWTAHEDMPDYYHSIDIYVCASISEGTPNPVLEAMACGLPVLTTNVGIVSEAFGTKQQEFIVQDRHSSEFINKLRKLVENSSLRKQLRDENIQSIKSWGWPQQIDQWESFICMALNTNRSKHLIENQLRMLRELISLSYEKHSINQRQQLKVENNSKTVCLAMVVCNESSIIERCLNSLLGYVNQYFILDTGSTDNTVEIIQQTIGHLPGTIESTEFTSFDDLRSQLFAGASQDSDFILFIDADETLQSIGSSLRLDSSFDVGRVEVSMQSHSVVQPRLIRSTTQLSCSGTYSESVVVPSNVRQCFFDELRIQHHADGNRHTSRDSLGDEKKYLSNKLLSNQCVDDYLSLTRVYLRLNDADGAREILTQVCSLEIQDESVWQAHYLLGLLLEDSKSTWSDAEHHHSRAFEIAPDRVEALFRLIKMRVENKEYETAQSLAKIAAEIDIPVHTDYFERRLYEDEIPAYLKLLAKKILESKDRVLKNKKALELETKDLNANKEIRLNKSFKKASAQTEVCPKLTIGMATYDDYDGVYFSVMAISLYHPEILDDIELIVIDNNPGGKCSVALKALCETIGFARYIAVSEIRGTAVRDSIFAYARGAAVLCMDAHVMLIPSSIKRLIDYFDNHAQSVDLYQGPLLSEDKMKVAYCMSEVWREGMLGVWEYDSSVLSTDLTPFEIQMQGLGLFACRKDAWPKFNPRFSGFGGEEGYIHEKFRQQGGKVFCLPFLQWIHRFERPMGIQYSNTWEDRVRNYLIGLEELGQDTQALEQHFASHLGFETMAKVRKNFDQERAQPMYQFDAIFCIKHNRKANNEKGLQRQLKHLGIAHRVQYIELLQDAQCSLNNRLMTQIKIVERAQLYGYERIFILDEQSLFHRRADYILNSALSELLNQDWDVCYFDIPTSVINFSKDSETSHLVRIENLNGSMQTDNSGYVIAINHSGYAKFITNARARVPQLKYADTRIFSVTPMLATQIEFLESVSSAICYIDPEEI